jgi:hypothetical protein
MSLSMYEIAAPVFAQQMTALATLLDQAQAHCAEHKIEESVVCQMRLFPDMFSMAQQVRQATGHVKGGMARLAGADVPKPAADGASFAELKDQVASALEAVGGYTQEQLAGSEDKEVELVRPTGTQTFAGRDYLLHNAIPQVCFHVTTCHAILRHAGVEIGKRHYLTPASK